jgi:peptidyl-prolyl cis-trans isomerase SurA
MRGRRILLSWLLAVCLPGAFVPPAGARIVDGLVAVVNDEPVTFSEFRESVAEGLGIPEGDADLHLREERDLGRILRGLEALVETLLVRQELARLGQPIPEQDVERAVESVRRSNDLTEAEFRAALEREGISLAGYKRRLRWQMERGAIVRARKLKEVTVTEEEVREYFRENADRFREGGEIHVKTLFFPVSAAEEGADPPVAARIAARQAAEHVRSGLVLAEAARRVAPTFPGVVVLDAGFVAAADLLPEIQREVLRMKTGEASPPFFTENGGYLVRVLGRRGGTLPEFSDVRDALSGELVDRRSEKAYADILSELKHAATIDVRL